MKTYCCNKFTGVWPVGSAAIVHANDEVHAAELLNKALQAMGLKGDAIPDDMHVFPAIEGIADVNILCDGDY